MGMGLLVVTFAAGLLAGAASSRALTARETEPVAAKAECSRRGPHSIFEELELSPEQRQRIDAIMARRRARMDTVWKEHGAPIRAAHDSARAEVRQVLTPAQQAEYDRLRAQYRAEREKAKAAHGSSGGAPR
jgi:Spy/CpxP family protein refolding chaperone